MEDPSPRGLNIQGLILLYAVHTHSSNKIFHELEFQIMFVSQILPRGYLQYAIAH